MKTKTALMLIDVQRGLIEGFEDDWAEVLQTLAELVERARRAQIPVVYVQHDGGPGHPLEVGGKGWQIHQAWRLKTQTPSSYDGLYWEADIKIKRGETPCENVSEVLVETV
ncbi:MAG: isochorismatase family protein [Chloroflexota bacterium]|nr:isochorismatase family protein [Chloroflexota bacterium]